jgi:hypothetical protein
MDNNIFASIPIKIANDDSWIVENPFESVEASYD